MNLLLVVAGRHGSTPEIGEAIAEELHAVGHMVDVRKSDEAAGNSSEHLLAQMVMAPESDFRDWEEICAWAREIAISGESRQ
jgi:menaquinone-dependent protoporphyrinogen IX oxidase